MELPLDTILRLRASAYLQVPSDYVRYRGRLSKRLAKIRRALHVQQRHTKTYKAKAPTEEDYSSDARYGDLVLVTAERAWARAMEDRSALETKDSPGRRKHITTRLRRARKCAQQLVKLLSNDINTGDVAKLQAQVYLYLIVGALYFDKKNWSKSLEAYSGARVGLSALDKTLSSKSRSHKKSVEDIAPAEEEISILYRDLLSDIVDSSLRICGQQLKLSKGFDVVLLAKTHAPKKEEAFTSVLLKIDPTALRRDSAEESAANSVKSVLWRDYEAVLDNADVSVAIKQALDADSELRANLYSDSATQKGHLPKRLLDKYDDVLLLWQNSVDAVKQAIQDEAGTSEDSARHNQSLQIAFTFTSYNLILRRIERDSRLVRRLDQDIVGTKAAYSKVVSRIQDQVRQFDNIIQSVEQVYDLPGVLNDDELCQSLEAMSTFNKAKRIICIARSYALASKRLEALALFAQAKSWLDRSSELAKDSVIEYFDQSDVLQALESLRPQLVKAQALAQVTVAQQSASNDTGTTAATRISVLDSLDQWPANEAHVTDNLVSLLPSLRVAPVKPMYFDIAFNYISYNDSQDTFPDEESQEPTGATPVSGTAAAAQPSQRKSRFLGSLFGR